MPDADTLGLFAELGLGYTGFVVIFFAFSRGLGEFAAADKLRIRTMLLGSFWVVFAAVVPLVLAGLRTDGGFAPRLAAGLALAAFTALYANLFVHVLRLGPARATVRDANFYLTWLLALAIVAALLAVLAAPDAAAGGYGVALLAGLALCTANFVTTAFARLFGQDGA